jgi:chorismate dehydratase
MLHGAQRSLFELDFRLPAECADRLAEGTADIGIVPSVEFPRLNLELIPGAGIACRGAVRSILLVSKTSPENIRVLAADSSSRTSVMLARIILARRYSAEPRVTSLAPDLPSMLEASDAALIIGDPALRLDPPHLPFLVLDLGQGWVTMTGLPMVFAVWAGRRGFVTPDLAAPFLESCRFGLSNIDEIVSAEAEKRGISQALAREYLTRNVCHELSEREYQGMRLFLQYAAEFAVEAPGRVPG